MCWWRVSWMDEDRAQTPGERTRMHTRTHPLLRRPVVDAAAVGLPLETELQEQAADARAAGRVPAGGEEEDEALPEAKQPGGVLPVPAARGGGRAASLHLLGQEEQVRLLRLGEERLVL